jgi:hypothetical protein
MTKQIRAYIPDDTHQLRVEACTARDTTPGEVIGTALRGLLDPNRQEDQLAVVTEQLSQLLTIVTDIVERLDALTEQNGQHAPPIPAQDPLAFYTALQGVAPAGQAPASHEPVAAERVLRDPPKRRSLRRLFLKGE